MVEIRTYDVRTETVTSVRYTVHTEGGGSAIATYPHWFVVRGQNVTRTEDFRAHEISCWHTIAILINCDLFQL